jgi:hypothetical protein
MPNSFSGFVYAVAGPPFNFLGNFAETQRNNFFAWVNARTKNFPAIKLHHQIRAEQLRKTAGILETFYSTVNDQKLTPTFQKPSWQPGPNGHFTYAHWEDQLPMTAVSDIKALMKPQFQRDEEGVFFMNLVRNLIEKHEDNAQYATDAMAPVITGATGSNPQSVAALLANITTYFGQTQYLGALVKDQTDQYKGQPRYRVHQLDQPTIWELEQVNHSPAGSPILIKQTDPVQDPIP